MFELLRHVRNMYNQMLFFKDFIHLFLERGKGGRKRGKHQCVVASHTPPTGDLACNPGMCPDWESNQQPFGSQASSQCTEPHQPRTNILLMSKFWGETVDYDSLAHV